MTLWKRRNREHRTKPKPYDAGGIRGEWFPAVLRPDECVFDRQMRCVREEHEHNGDTRNA
ncbi:hypothetical protein [Nocardia otitidiscaviarum]|uniref:hypothetical protein n=1 Tax=Nocardia otitidiscaviarum TaxID=1823 RepID=UPI0011DE2EEF|nr:hypothetical protein [Nocardia otitidiscaviarum]